MVINGWDNWTGGLKWSSRHSLERSLPRPVEVENLAIFSFRHGYGRLRNAFAVDGTDLLSRGAARTLRTDHWIYLEGLTRARVRGTDRAQTREDGEARPGRSTNRHLSAPRRVGGVETIARVNAPGARQPHLRASCTKNCITPIVESWRRIGLKKAVMTTVHAYTSSQSSVDGPSQRFRRGRAAAANLVPATTGAALATTRALPEYAGLFDGIALRVPIPVGSIADITFLTSRETSADEVNQILAEKAETKRYAGVLGVSRDPLVSSDVVGDPRASVVDLETHQSGRR